VDEHRIGTVEELREVVRDPIPGIETKNADHIDEKAAAFIADAPFLVLATANAAGQLDASPKGDEPGFVVVEDERTIVIPDRPGNNLAYGLTNILENPHVGVLFMIPGTTETLRINGTAELSRDPELLEQLAARGKPAVLAIRVGVEECLFHCAKAFIRSKLWKPETWPKREKISWGEVLAPRLGGDESLVKVIDDLAAEDERVNL
jgi:PPOX class probable FMN-dependent enzyme